MLSQSEQQCIHVVAMSRLEVVGIAGVFAIAGIVEVVGDSAAGAGDNTAVVRIG